MPPRLRNSCCCWLQLLSLQSLLLQQKHLLLKTFVLVFGLILPAKAKTFFCGRKEGSTFICAPLFSRFPMGDFYSVQRVNRTLSREFEIFETEEGAINNCC